MLSEMTLAVGIDYSMSGLTNEFNYRGIVEQRIWDRGENAQVTRRYVSTMNI